MKMEDDLVECLLDNVREDFFVWGKTSIRSPMTDEEKSENIFFRTTFNR